MTFDTSTRPPPPSHIHPLSSHHSVHLSIHTLSILGSHMNRQTNHITTTITASPLPCYPLTMSPTYPPIQPIGQSANDPVRHSLDHSFGRSHTQSVSHIFTHTTHIARHSCNLPVTQSLSCTRRLPTLAIHPSNHLPNLSSFLFLIHLFTQSTSKLVMYPL